jgi:AraC family transcriptional regulator of adaptative response/methylated-DNA-[protein]-cysteine methyltransferase
MPHTARPPATPRVRDVDRDRWEIIRRRDAAADGQFLYSVKTTGVYCRPSCASRLPRRENVRFHATAADAERAGFRPCKRCRPNEAAPVDAGTQAVERACRFIEAGGQAVDLQRLARAVGMSPFHFHRVFKRLTGVTPKAYAAANRSRRVRDELVAGSSVSEAIRGSGYRSNGAFYATAAARLGMKPSSIRAGGAGTAIRFAVGESTLGAVLVAATAKGVCAIFLGDEPVALERALLERFPKADLARGDAGFDEYVARAIALVEIPSAGLDLPLDIRGTAFQLRVWEALRRIPPGATASYTAIALAIGRPKAVRAVAQACAANPAAIAIPCHRVLRSDASLAGYRWGMERKAELLRRERDGGAAPANQAGRGRSKASLSRTR